nr:RNA-directed DNA polymerase, eukaryota, reverse transcriptase zinc-binding domain protein [Tanacetum cinerariifolium]
QLQQQQQQQQPNPPTASQPRSDQQSFHLVDEIEDENEEEPIPTPTSKKTSRGPRLKSKAAKNKEKETQVEVKKRARIWGERSRLDNEGGNFVQNPHGWLFLKGKHKWTNPESTNARRNCFRVIDEKPEHFGDDALPRPPWLQRLAKSQRSGSNSTASSGSNPMMYYEFMKEQYKLDRKAKMQVIEQESEKRRHLIHAQRIAEEMRVLQIDTRGMDPADAVIINTQKARIRAAYQPPTNWRLLSLRFDLATSKKSIMSSLRRIEEKIDAGCAHDEDRALRVNSLQELDGLEKLESMDLVQKARLSVKNNLIKFLMGLSFLERFSVGSDFYLVNGSPTSKFSLKRVLRQGDPLSPFLFIIVIEGLHIALRDGLGASMFQGVKAGSYGINLSHLCYADGVIIIYDWNQNDMDNIIRMLNVFYIVFGLKIYINKSNLYGVGFSSTEFNQMAAGTGYAVGGRLNLMKSVVGSLDIYYLSFFKAREAVIKALESLRGLGVDSLKAFNSSLLLKWRCLFLKNPSSLWVRVVKSIHGDEADMEIDNDSDFCIWSLSYDGDFSVSNARKHIDDCMLPNLLPRTRWYKGLDIDLILCPVCNGQVESNIHIFFYCDMDSVVWRLVHAWSDSKILILSSFEDLDSWRASKDSKDRAYVILTTTLWMLWLLGHGFSDLQVMLLVLDLFIVVVTLLCLFT